MKKIITCAILLWLAAASAQQDPNNANGFTEDSQQVVDTSPLREIGSKYQNGIKLLRNRFRIDYKVDEITMVFFRKYGSAPIVLVRPDGSKIFLSQAYDHGLDWYDATTYDMIRMREPMPGPWQAVGQILPGSRVMVLSDIRLNVESMPRVLFSGEILKQTAFLTNGDKPIDYTEFRDVVQLTMKFISTNNPNYSNFGAQPELITTFEDSGKGMDERPLDGTFTGQFNLNAPSGEWKPVFTVVSPMFSREQVDEPVILLENPISVDAELDTTGQGFHKLLIDADRDQVDMSSLLIDGKVRFPNGDIQNFSITRLSDGIRTHSIVNYEFGIFHVKLTAYGNTVDGRDFILEVPDFSFLSEELPLDSAEQEMTLAEIPSDPSAAEALALRELRRAELPMAPAEAMSKSQLLTIIGIVNAILLLLGGVTIWLLVGHSSRRQAVSERMSRALQYLAQLPARTRAFLAGLTNKTKSKDPADASE